MIRKAPKCTTKQLSSANDHNLPVTLSVESFSLQKSLFCITSGKHQIKLQIIFSQVFVQKISSQRSLCWVNHFHCKILLLWTNTKENGDKYKCTIHKFSGMYIPALHILQ